MHRFENGRNTRGMAGQSGFTLIELMVSIALGMLVVAAALGIYLAGVQSSRVNTQIAQMNDDGLAALAALSSHLAQADYNPDLLNLGQTPPVFACPAGFVDEAALALVCNGSGTDGAAISVAYLADQFNTAVSGAAAAAGGVAILPTDCLGNQVQADRVDPAKPGAFKVAESRFFVQNNKLMCKGNGGVTEFSAPPQPLMDNVEGMTLTFAVADPAAVAAAAGATAVGGRVPTGYLSAEAIGNPNSHASQFATPAALAAFAGLPLAKRWSHVVGVRICLVMRSEVPIVFVDPALSRYVGCDGNLVAATDRRLRKSFVTTVVFRNRLPVRHPAASAGGSS